MCVLGLRAQPRLPAPQAPGTWGEHSPRGRGAVLCPALCTSQLRHLVRWSRCAWQSMVTHCTATALPVPACQPRGEAADCSHMRSCRFVTDLLHRWLQGVLCSTFPTSLDSL